MNRIWNSTTLDLFETNAYTNFIVFMLKFFHANPKLIYVVFVAGIPITNAVTIFQIIATAKNQKRNISWSSFCTSFINSIERSFLYIDFHLHLYLNQTQGYL